MIKRFILAFSAGLLALALVLGYIGQRTNQELEATVTELFNRQQLSLARQIASDIRTHFGFLETSLLAMGAACGPRETGLAEVADLDRLFRIYSAWDVVALGHASLDGSGALAVSADGIGHGPWLMAMLADSLEWARAQDGEAVRMSRDFVLREGPLAGLRVVLLAAPTVGPDGRAIGLDFLVVDAMAVAQRHGRGVRSGQTGYAWVINHEGIFLSHFEDQFLGQSSFTVRAERNPKISYSRINQLVAEKLLKGQEGTDWYVSGWHRGAIGEMRKPLAYSPAYYAGEENPELLWSVGLAAPASEVYGIMEPFLARQWIAAGASVLLALSALAAVIFLSLRWAQILHREVEEKTADLRVERDKVRDSLARLLEAQEKLVRSERFAAVGEAAAHLAHEIKNPLLLMGGFAAQVRKSLNEDGPKAEKLRDKLQIVEDEARRLEYLLREVSGFTKLSKPTFVLRDINEVVEGTLRLVESDFSERGIRCVRELDRSLPPVPHDPAQMRQVLLNLVKNAGEAMPAGGTLTMRTWREGGSVKIAVQDTGTGMSPQALERLFSPFFTTKAKGTGLGLAVSFRIMEDHGGEIGATSTEGQGSTFTLSLPLTHGGEPEGKA